MGAPLSPTPRQEHLAPPSPQVVAFPPFELDRRSGELRKHGAKIRLADQPFQILVLLLERPGDVIMRDEIRQRLWSSDTFVDFDAGLSSAVRKLRDALGDSAERPRFVETVPKRGYRFIGPVAAPPGAPTPVAHSDAPMRAWRRPQRLGAVLLLTLMAGVILLYGRAEGWWGRTGAPAAAIGSIAVLPFANLTGEAGQDYFVDGVTDGLTSRLAQVGGLQVISRTSAMQYRQTAKRVPEIGRELTADALVEGSVGRSGSQLHISVKLIHASTDRHVWARQYDGDVSTVVALQDEIAQAITGAIRGQQPATAARPRGERGVNPRAYDAYLKGLSVRGLDTVAGFRNAIAYFEEATAAEPGFAAAHAALAQTHLQFLYAGTVPPRDVVPSAEASARRALELDDTLPLAHRVLGAILHRYYWRWEDGDREIQRALTLDPNSVEALALAAFGLIRRGQFDQAIAQTQRARERDPLSSAAAVDLGTALRAAGRYEPAIVEYRRALSLDPGSARAHLQIGATLGLMGQWTNAVSELDIAVSQRPDNSRFLAYLGYARAMAGRQPEAREILAALEARARRHYVSSFGLALVHDALGEKEPAIALLQRAYDEHAVELSQLTQYPAFQSVRHDPRYEALMRRVRRPEINPQREEPSR